MFPNIEQKKPEDYQKAFKEAAAKGFVIEAAVEIRLLIAEIRVAAHHSAAETDAGTLFRLATNFVSNPTENEQMALRIAKRVLEGSTPETP